MFQKKILQRKAVLPKHLMVKRYLRRLQSYICHTTPAKLFNLLSITIETGLRREVVRGYPFIAQIEPTNICQLQCPSCPTGQGINPDPSGKMPLATFFKIIDELKDYLYEILLYGFGEPMLLKDIYSMIGYAAKNNIRTVISTNLCHLQQGDVERLVDSGLELLVVSLDGITQSTYQKYRVRGDVEAVKRNIEAIMRRKRELGRRDPAIQLQFIVMDHNRHEVPGAIEYSRSSGVEEFILKEVGPRYIPRLGADGSEKEQAQKLKVELNICPKLWYEAYIGWNGVVRPCCLTFDGSLGNINSENFDKIWNNERYTASRRIFRRNPVEAPAFPVPCFGCHLLSQWMDPLGKDR